MRDLIDEYLTKQISSIIELATDLCCIPSPTGNETAKAKFVLEYLQQSCGVTGWQDKIGNVIYLHKVNQDNHITVFCAHIDTVFENLDDISVSYKENRIYAPAIYDNSINVAALLFAVKMLQEIDAKPNKNIMFVFSVGEEGQGNLRGVRYLVNKYGKDIEEFVAVDLGFDTVTTAAVGSRRYRVDITAAGGHGWKNFGNSNAIAAASEVIHKLYQLKLPESPKATYNVGLISGGMSVNSIAGDCSFYVSFRSESPEMLEQLIHSFHTIEESCRQDSITINVVKIGERPGGKIPEKSPLVEKIVKVRKLLGMETVYGANSTDANYPMSLGIPSITIGVCNGANNHSLNEYIDTESLETGCRIFLYMMMDQIDSQKQA